MNASTISKTAFFALCASIVLAQEPNPVQRPGNQSAGQDGAPVAVFRVEVVERTTPAINYLHRGGSTKVDFRGTPLMEAGKGEAKVESQRGVTHVDADFKDMAPPSSFGPEYLTYVLWAVSPDGRPVNLGELTLDHYGAGSKSEIQATSDIQTFGLIVTAEPYYAVTQPSDVVVLENVIRPDTRGVVEAVNARYELLPRGSYVSRGKGAFTPIIPGKKDPFELYEAENAVQLARAAGAEKYAADSFQKAVDSLAQAQKYEAQKPGQKPVITMAREAALRAEDSRVITLRRQQEEALQNERDASQAREQAERAKAEVARTQADSARLIAEEESRQRAQADASRMAAESAKAEALAAAKLAESERLAANQAKQEALAEQQKLAEEAGKARAAAAEAENMRQQAEQEKTNLRQQLLAQFNAILQTRDTARGLIVNMSDVLFDTAKYTLKPGAREKLAKVAGIVLSHPGLKLEVEGHTDSVGGDDYNMKLSENRAGAVRDYLVEQGVASDNITSHGFGKTKPVADNSTAEGRQRNRRVELVVSGEMLGSPVSGGQTGGN